MNKRGQFYIVAAIIIVLAIAGIASIKTYTSVTTKPRSIESMGSELREEGFRIVDYGIYNRKDVSSLINNFTVNYSSYFLKKSGNANVIFVYGNESNIYSAKLDNIGTGKVTATIGSSGSTWVMSSEFVNRTTVIPEVTPTGKIVTVNILGNDYKFDIKNDNEMFYFVVVQEKEGEIYVEKS